jgi:glycosyltransferase involved in cell wall biosynthesis
MTVTVPYTPLVSVILPTFNRLQFLPAAVDSVFSQSFEDWELIVADDGSDEEETRAYLIALGKRPRVKVIWLPREGNPGAARNAALREAQGEYIAFLDSDDLWLPSKLEVQLAALRAVVDRQWSYTDFILIDQAGNSINAQRNPDRVLYEGKIVEQLLQLKSGIAMPTVIARRQLVERAGGFDEHQGLHEDYDMWLRLALLCEVGLVAQPLACVRRHDEHFSSGGIRNFQARSRVFEKMKTLLTDSHQLSVLRTERARNDAALALANAAAGGGGAVWRMLACSWRHSWRSASWYASCAKAMAHLFLPVWLVTIVRQYRAPAPRVALRK